MGSEREELLARVQKATGPSEDLDWDVYLHVCDHHDFNGGLQAFTRSIDAALALVERVLPGNDVLVMRDTGQWEANIGPQESFVSFEGKCSNAPLSILAALLAALQPPEAP